MLSLSEVFTPSRVGLRKEFNSAVVSIFVSQPKPKRLERFVANLRN